MERETIPTTGIYREQDKHWCVELDFNLFSFNPAMVHESFFGVFSKGCKLWQRDLLTTDFRLGATRNLILRGIHPGITEQRIRDDLDHIHNIVVISVAFEDGDAYISLNSINNSLFARTCMMSRVTYKGVKIEWCPDECSQHLPKVQYASKNSYVLKNSKNENIAPQPKKNGSAMNRFQMLNLDEDDHDSSEADKDGTFLSDLSSR